MKRLLKIAYHLVSVLIGTAIAAVIVETYKHKLAPNLRSQLHDGLLIGFAFALLTLFAIFNSVNDWKGLLKGIPFLKRGKKGGK